MFNPDGCFCCNPPEDPCTLSGCTWSSTDMSDTDLTDGVAYHNAVSGTTPDGTYEITNVQETGTGNDAPCRKITISTTTAPHKPDTIYTICWKDNATHNPATQCPLTSVSFCVESKRHSDSDSDLSDSVVFVVRQGGKIYATATHSVGVNWKRASGVYTSGQFNWINGTGNPNFSASGTPIEFGFTLKLQVGEDEEPLDVVMFDNLCVTRVAGCTNSCLNGDCDYTNDGSSLTVRKTSSGITYSVSSSEGLPPDSHRITFNVFNPSNERARIVCDSSLQDILDLSGVDCLAMTSVLICFNFKVNSVVPGGGFYIWSDVKPDEVPSGSNLPPPGTPIWNSTTGFGTWMQKSAGGTVSSTMQANLSDYYPVIEISGNGQFDVSIDNICVKAVYGTCASNDWVVTQSGVTVVEKSSSCGGTWAEVAAELNEILANPITVSQIPTQSYCYWIFRQRSVVMPLVELTVYLFHNMNGTGDWGLRYSFGGGITHSTAPFSSTDGFPCPVSVGLSADPAWTPIDTCIQFSITGATATATPA